jgi:hypothetical protein
MAFFIEGRRAQVAQRVIDAYNYFYLFLESRFKLKHKNVESAHQLLRLKVFRDAVSSVIADPIFAPSLKQTKIELERWQQEPEAVALNIVKLRGALRHHSIGDPNRWNPIEQKKYRDEAMFLGAVCQQIADPISFDVTWEDRYARAFMEQAAKMGYKTEVAVTMTLSDGSRSLDVNLNFSFPQIETSPLLAMTVLEHALADFNRRPPDLQLLGIRARILSTGSELFRYDLGPGVPRV